MAKKLEQLDNTLKVKSKKNDDIIDNEIFAIKKVKTSNLNDIDFQIKLFDYDNDADNFNDLCEKEAKLNKVNMISIIEPDENIDEEHIEMCYEDEEKKKPYDLLMVKVEISRGYHSGNVFYKMQIVKHKIRGVYLLFTRWGRVNTIGQYQKTPFNTLEEAKKEFCKIFKSKTQNLWEDRVNFVKKKGKYRLITFKKK